MKYVSIFVIIAFLLILIQCGGSKLEEGDANYTKGNYTQAINNYLAYKKSNPENKEINSKIALAYFKKGKKLFNRSKNIDSFSGNYEKAQKYLDESDLSADQKVEYSDLLYEFATAYYNTKPKNEIQKEQFFNNTLDYLSASLEQNPQNSKADSMLNHIYMENFQKMFDEGVKFYTRAKKESNNPDLYISAENYFTKAVKYNSESEEAKKYLNDTHKKTLGILQNIHPLSFCVPNYKIEKNACFIAIAIKNFSMDPITFDLNSLILNTVDGQKINADLKKTVELKKALQEKTELKPRALVDGQIIYTIAPGTKLESISYSQDGQVLVTKYFPN